MQTSPTNSFDQLITRFYHAGQPMEEPPNLCNFPLPSGGYDPTGEWDVPCQGLVVDGVCTSCGFDHAVLEAEQEAAEQAWQQKEAA